MKYITIFILLLTAANVFGQVVRTSSVVLTAGVPAHTPTAQGAAVALDTVAGLLYIWDQGAWGRAAVTPSQLSDSLAALPLDTVTLLVADSVLVYYAGGLEIGRDTIRAGAGIGLSGSGVAGYLPQYTGANTMDTTGVHWDSANGMLGVGTMSPAYPLHISTAFANSVKPLFGVYTSSFGSASYTSGFEVMAPNLPTGNELYYSVGVSASTRNRASTAFYYAGSGSTSNRLSFGLYGVNNVLNILGTSNVGIGTTLPTARLHIRGLGSTSATTALRVENSGGGR